MTAAPNSDKGTILLVDDEQSVRAIVLKILRRANYNVLEAENGEAALRVADSHPGKIDLLVTDMYMPGLRGPEVAHRLALTRPGLRVLFMSGYSENVISHHGVLNDSASFIQKPFTPKSLAQKVREVIDSL